MNRQQAGQQCQMDIPNDQIGYHASVAEKIGTWNYVWIRCKLKPSSHNVLIYRVNSSLKLFGSDE